MATLLNCQFLHYWLCCKMTLAINCNCTLCPMAGDNLSYRYSSVFFLGVHLLVSLSVSQSQKSLKQHHKLEIDESNLLSTNKDQMNTNNSAK